MSTFIVIYAIIIFVTTVSLVLSQEFCSNTNPIDRIFFMSEYTFIVKGQDYYRQRSGLTFAGTKGMGPTVFFKTSFQTINTGFAINQIPKCIDNEPDCKNQGMLLNMAFIIGHTNAFAGQAYRAYRLETIGGINSLTPITKSEMPFGMEAEAEIGTQDFWPIAAKDGVYRHSAFSELYHLILHLTYELGSDKLYYKFLSTKGWTNDWISAEPKLIDSNEKPFIYGFFQINQILYAIAKSAQNSQTIIAYETKEYFKSENFLTLETNLTGCNASVAAPVTVPVTVPTNLSSTTEGLGIGSTEPKRSRSWLWILFFVIIVVLILLTIFIIAWFVIYNKSKRKTPLKAVNTERVKKAKSSVPQPTIRSNSL